MENYKLSSLSIDGGLISNFNNLSFISNLKILRITNNEKKIDYSQLGQFTSLRELALPLTDLSDKPTAPYVINQLSLLKTMPNLKSLDLSGHNIEELSGLKFCPSMETLKLSRNNISSLESLPERLINLKHLDLSNNTLTEVGITLIEYSALERLNLSKNQFAKISNSIPFSINLKYLDVSSNALKSISFLTFYSLEELDLSYNKDINLMGDRLFRAFSGSNLSLKSLRADFIGIVDFKYLKDLKRIKKISVKGNTLLNVDLFKLDN